MSVWALVGFIADVWAAPASLHVGVHRAAGTVLDIAADGADGQCSVQPARVSCPATRPVTFRWGPEGSEFQLVGETVVAPGEVGVAFVMASDEARGEALARLGAGVTESTVRELFLGPEAPVPSLGMIKRLIELRRHPDLTVRRAVIDALLPFLRHTASDPFDRFAPPLVPDGVLADLAQDENLRVRRRLAGRVRDVRSSQHAEEVLEVLLDLTDDRRPVARAAVASLSLTARADLLPGEVAWERALRQVKEPGPPGRAAANTLGHLAGTVTPGPLVDPVEAVGRTLQHHPERTWSVWFAWRRAVPLERSWVELLLRTTVGLHGGLLRWWAQEEPDALADLLLAWEPGEPHSERFLEAQFALREVGHPRLRAVLGLPPLPDNLSGAEGEEGAG